MNLYEMMRNQLNIKIGDKFKIKNDVFRMCADKIENEYEPGHWKQTELASSNMEHILRNLDRIEVIAKSGFEKLIETIEYCLLEGCDNCKYGHEICCVVPVNADGREKLLKILKEK